MKIFILFKTSLKAFSRHPGRSLLTVLGIMIGVAAIIVTFSIGRGAEEKIKAQILTMGEGAVYIIPGNIVARGAVRSSLAIPFRLTTTDMIAIKKQIPEIREISRGTYSYQLLEYQAAVMKDQVIGTDANIFTIMRTELAYGIPFNKLHVLRRSNVAVIGEKVKNTLFGTEFPINKPIRIAGHPFVVIGILAHQEHFVGTDDPNGHVFIPFTTAKKYFSQENEADDDLGFIALNIPQTANSAAIVRNIKRILRFRHDIEPNEEEDFLILDQESISEAAEDAADVVKLFGLIAASISLLVGGIGVMNIMLVSVKERVQEIGLRMAIGATQALIQLQFLLEAIVLCALGGLIGILLGFVSQWSITRFTILTSIIEIGPMFFSFLVTLVVGIFFGYYPARVASLFNPIDALLEK